MTRESNHESHPCTIPFCDGWFPVVALSTNVFLILIHLRRRTRRRARSATCDVHVHPHTRCEARGTERNALRPRLSEERV